MHMFFVGLVADYLNLKSSMSKEDKICELTNTVTYLRNKINNRRSQIKALNQKGKKKSLNILFRIKD